MNRVQQPFVTPRLSLSQIGLPPIASTTVGSFPRPAWLTTAQGTEVSFRLEGQALREAQDDATELVLVEQERLGVDLLTDGEQRRIQFIFHVLERLEGFDVNDRRLKAIRRRAVADRLVPRVVGPIRHPAPILADDVLFAKAHSTRPIKMAVPGPLTVIDTTYDETGRDEADLALEIAEALNEEILALQGAGCSVVQIDEPAMTRYPDKVRAYGARALDRCLEGVTVPTVVHLCFGYPSATRRQHEFGYADVLGELLQTRIGGFSLEFARSGFDPSLLRTIEDRLVMYGCIDPGPATMEDVDTVARRIRAALDHMDADRLLVSPDCGLTVLTRAQAEQKVETLVAAANLVRAGLQ